MSKEKNLFNKKEQALGEFFMGIVALLTGFFVLRHIIIFNGLYLFGEKIVILLFGVGWVIGGAYSLFLGLKKLKNR